MEIQTSLALKRYVLVHFLLLLVLAALALGKVSALGGPLFVGVAVFVTFSLVALSAHLDRRLRQNQWLGSGPHRSRTNALALRRNARPR